MFLFDDCLICVDIMHHVLCYVSCIVLSSHAMLWQPPPSKLDSLSSGAAPAAQSAFGQLATKKKKAVRYKFCSGFSNAVKRPVSIREFMQ